MARIPEWPDGAMTDGKVVSVGVADEIDVPGRWVGWSFSEVLDREAERPDLDACAFFSDVQRDRAVCISSVT